MPNIIIVEDELIAAEYLKEILNSSGFKVLGIIDNGKEAMQEIPQISPDIVLMDIMLKDNISGSEVGLHLKQFSPKIAIIFLTAYVDKEMIEYAKDSHSYGYLMKPYNEVEIVSTIEEVLIKIKKSNKIQLDQNDNIIKINETLFFNMDKKKLFKNDKEVELSEVTINFLELLCKQLNSTVSNEQISLHLWGEIKNPVTLRTQIYRIRTQIGTDIIHNINGLGYMIRTESLAL